MSQNFALISFLVKIFSLSSFSADEVATLPKEGSVGHLIRHFDTQETSSQQPAGLKVEKKVKKSGARFKNSLTPVMVTTEEKESLKELVPVSANILTYDPQDSLAASSSQATMTRGEFLKKEFEAGQMSQTEYGEAVTRPDVGRKRRGHKRLGTTGVGLGGHGSRSRSGSAGSSDGEDSLGGYSTDTSASSSTATVYIDLSESESVSKRSKSEEFEEGKPISKTSPTSPFLAVDLQEGLFDSLARGLKHNLVFNKGTQSYYAIRDMALVPSGSLATDVVEERLNKKITERHEVQKWISEIQKSIRQVNRVLKEPSNKSRITIHPLETIMRKGKQPIYPLSIQYTKKTVLYHFVLSLEEPIELWQGQGVIKDALKWQKNVHKLLTKISKTTSESYHNKFETLLLCPISDQKYKLELALSPDIWNESSSLEETLKNSSLELKSHGDALTAFGFKMDARADSKLTFLGMGSLALQPDTPLARKRPLTRQFSDMVRKKLSRSRLSKQEKGVESDMESSGGSIDSRRQSVESSRSSVDSHKSSIKSKKSSKYESDRESVDAQRGSIDGASSSLNSVVGQDISAVASPKKRRVRKQGAAGSAIQSDGTTEMSPRKRRIKKESASAENAGGQATSSSTTHPSPFEGKRKRKKKTETRNVSESSGKIRKKSSRTPKSN